MPDVPLPPGSSQVYGPPGVLAPPGGWGPTVFAPPPSGSATDDGKCTGWLSRDLPFCPWWFLPLIIIVILLLFCCVAVACAKRRRRQQQQLSELQLVQVDEAPLLHADSMSDEVNMNNLMMSNPLAEVDPDDRSLGPSEAPIAEPPGRSKNSQGSGFEMRENNEGRFRASTSYMVNPLSLEEGGELFGEGSDIDGGRMDAALLAEDNWRNLVDGQGQEYYVNTQTGVTTYEMPLMMAQRRLSLQRECREKLVAALELLDAPGLLESAPRADGSTDAEMVSLSGDALLDAPYADGSAGAELLELKASLQDDLAVVERACAQAVIGDGASDGMFLGDAAAATAGGAAEATVAAVSAVELDAVLARTDTSLARLEVLAVEGCGTDGGVRPGGKLLWGKAAMAMGNPGAGGSQNDVWSQVLAHVRKVRENLKPVRAAANSTGGDDFADGAWLRTLKTKLRPVGRKMTIT